MRALAGGRFKNTGPQALAAHLEQAETRDAADLDARAIVLQRFLHRLLDLPDVGAVLHVDKVDDDQPSHVAQPELPSDLVSSFQIGAERGLFDIMFARRSP